MDPDNECFIIVYGCQSFSIENGFLKETFTDTKEAWDQFYDYWQKLQQNENLAWFPPQIDNHFQLTVSCSADYCQDGRFIENIGLKLSLPFVISQEQEKMIYQILEN